MSVSTELKPEDCNCFVVRSAARHVTQLYDQFLAPVGLHVTQFSILVKLKRLDPATINALPRKWSWIAPRSAATFFRSSAMD